MWSRKSSEVHLLKNLDFFAAYCRFCVKKHRAALTQKNIYAEFIVYYWNRRKRYPLFALSVWNSWISLLAPSDGKNRPHWSLQLFSYLFTQRYPLSSCSQPRSVLFTGRPLTPFGFLQKYRIRWGALKHSEIIMWSVAPTHTNTADLRNSFLVGEFCKIRISTGGRSNTDSLIKLW